MSTLPGLLLLHGVGDDAACWSPFVARLRGRPGLADLIVATPTAPAHGGRRASAGHTLAWPDLLGEAIAHAEALAQRTAGRIVVGGHSMGAMTAMGVAAHRPELVAGTYLEDPPLLEALPEPADPAAPQRAAVPTDLSDFVAWFSELQAVPLDRVLQLVRAEHPAWEDSEYEPWARSKQAVDVDAFRQPVVFVHGESERIIRRAATPVVVVAGLPELGGMLAHEAAQGLAALPGWRVHRLPASHDVHRDAPDATADLLADLVRSLAG
jgi:pimeloyl-ACP methyl ester carboxylesterase